MQLPRKDMCPYRSFFLTTFSDDSIRPFPSRGFSVVGSCPQPAIPKLWTMLRKWPILINLFPEAFFQRFERAAFIAVTRAEFSASSIQFTDFDIESGVTALTDLLCPIGRISLMSAGAGTEFPLADGNHARDFPEEGSTALTRNFYFGVAAFSSASNRTKQPFIFSCIQSVLVKEEDDIAALTDSLNLARRLTDKTHDTPPHGVLGGKCTATSRGTKLVGCTALAASKP